MNKINKNYNLDNRINIFIVKKKIVSIEALSCLYLIMSLSLIGILSIWQLLKSFAKFLPMTLGEEK